MIDTTTGTVVVRIGDEMRDAGSPIAGPGHLERIDMLI
jgi:hypothetical protein